MTKDFSSESTGFSDDELAIRAKASDTGAFADLIVRYEAVADTLVRGYHVTGLEADDLRQEALTGFIKAVRSFDSGQNVSFRAYAVLCMKRQVQTAIKAGLAGKQQPLRDYLPLDDSLPDAWTDHTSSVNPEDRIIMDEESFLRKQKIKTLLSAFEQEALDLYLSGHSYEEMSRQMRSTPKAVDNALQRVRRKLRSAKL